MKPSPHRRLEPSPRLLLIDIGNTHTHLGIAARGRVARQTEFPTRAWFNRNALARLRAFCGSTPLDGVACCSVVPKATRRAVAGISAWRGEAPFLLTHRNAGSLRLRYPRPSSIGPDRLANALAARSLFGAPALVVDFGTAVTFDVEDASGAYAGGVIAPGLSAMTDYLHEKTALLPRIRVRDIACAIGKSTRQAMLIGAVHGYRGLVRELIGAIRLELGARRLPVIATGGYAGLLAARLPEIQSVRPDLTLEGLRLAWRPRTGRGAAASQRSRPSARPRTNSSK